MLSTAHALGHDNDCSVIRDRRCPRETRTIGKLVQRAVFKGQSRALLRIPKIIDDYNHHMNGADIANQLRSYYSTELKTCRTWVPIFFWLLDTAIINAHLVDKLSGSSMHHREFRQCLAQDLIENTKYSSLQKRNTNTRDIPAQIPPHAAKKFKGPGVERFMTGSHFPVLANGRP